jgi:hypothetical protein
MRAKNCGISWVSLLAGLLAGRLIPCIMYAPTAANLPHTINSTALGWSCLFGAN